MTHPAVHVCTCVHLEVEHVRASTGWPHPISYGPCLVPGCPCERFENAATAQPKDNAA